eukprot:TRINITY_DN3150_c0_g1_i1.p1 TRINITY_DN3150_c0_g1~~TRINITY_DN3150_c0_g1_i1.p1  ORF type:complete len:113 (+),score=13.56 TRINITY_DN3150_c0_g1_i1:523-861(+)
MKARRSSLPALLKILASHASTPLTPLHPRSRSSSSISQRHLKIILSERGQPTSPFATGSCKCPFRLYNTPFSPHVDRKEGNRAYNVSTPCCGEEPQGEGAQSSSGSHQPLQS